MNLIESVFEISKSFMEDPKYVSLNNDEIHVLCNDLKVLKKPEFPIPQENNILKGVLLELVAASINYCYWYGKFNVRPLNANSTKMYELLVNAFFDYDGKNNYWFRRCINRYYNSLVVHRFPLLKERKDHLYELMEKGEDFSEYVINNYEKKSINELMIELITLFPGFGEDIFLKRASLFFLQLNRRFGWFKDQLNDLHVPADYQVPKMLRYSKCIEYSQELSNKISDNELIPKHSQIECEIRSATILAVKKICHLSGWNVAEVDAFFFLNRHICDDAFHQTITSDY